MPCPSIARAAGPVLVAAVLIVTLAGCGRRGGLEPPPDPSVPAASHPDGVAGSGLRRPKPVPVTPPHDAFILDPLL